MFQVEQQMLRFGSKREKAYVKNKNKFKKLQKLLRRVMHEERG